jgi:hypothetical protein
LKAVDAFVGNLKMAEHGSTNYHILHTPWLLGKSSKSYVVRLGEHEDDVVIAASPRCDNNAANWSYEPDGSLTVGGFRPCGCAVHE